MPGSNRPGSSRPDSSAPSSSAPDRVQQEPTLVARQSYWLGTIPDALPPACHIGVPKAVFLIAPEQFSLAAESARDNRYMQLQAGADADRAMRQFIGLQQRLSRSGIVSMAFAGRSETPDAQFPNNVFATAPGRLLLGAMRHPVRQRELERPDIKRYFTQTLGYALYPLSRAHMVAELTGSMVIDRARNVGWCGLSERCDQTGAAAMHHGFALDSSYVFALQQGEYHTNVVLSALAGRALVVCPDGIADPAALDQMQRLYAGRLIELDRVEKAHYAGNCIALSPNSVWMSEQAADALRPESRARFAALGFAIESVPLDEIEKAGGSLRCMIGEIY